MLADADEAVATGACVQAAAVALGVAHDDVAERWGLGRRHTARHRRPAIPPACGLVTQSCDRRRIPRPHDAPIPFAVLGVSPDATLDEVRSARRKLAAAVPSRPRWRRRQDGRDQRRLRRRRSPVAASCGQPAPPAPEPTVAPPHRRVATRACSTMHRRSRSTTLPVDAFEALLIVTSWMGEVLVDDPPYVLEVHLTEPGPCWCRLDLVPDAGGSTVTLTVASIDGSPCTRRRSSSATLGRQPQPPVSRVTRRPAGTRPRRTTQERCAWGKPAHMSNDPDRPAPETTPPPPSPDGEPPAPEPGSVPQTPKRSGTHRRFGVQGRRLRLRCGALVRRSRMA